MSDSLKSPGCDASPTHTLRNAFLASRHTVMKRISTVQIAGKFSIPTLHRRSECRSAFPQKHLFAVLILQFGIPILGSPDSRSAASSVANFSEIWSRQKRFSFVKDFLDPGSSSIILVSCRRGHARSSCAQSAQKSLVHHQLQTSLFRLFSFDGLIAYQYCPTPTSRVRCASLCINVRYSPQQN